MAVINLLWEAAANEKYLKFHLLPFYLYLYPTLSLFGGDGSVVNVDLLGGLIQEQWFDERVLWYKPSGQWSTPYTSGLFDNLSLSNWPPFDMDEAFDIVPIGHWVWLHCREWQPYQQRIIQPCYNQHVEDRMINKVSIYHPSNHHTLP